MRIFAAVSIPAELRAEARNAASPLRTAGGDVKWAKAEQLHFTLAFLGEVTAEAAQAAGDAVKAAAQAVPAFEAAFGGYGAFPDEDEPKVIWQGLSRGGRELGALAAALRSQLAKRGLPFDDKPFVAHL